MTLTNCVPDTRGLSVCDDLPISDNLYNMLRRPDEDFEAMLTRLESEVRDCQKLSKILCISRSSVYRLLKKYNIRNYGDN